VPPENSTPAAHHLKNKSGVAPELVFQTCSLNSWIFCSKQSLAPLVHDINLRNGFTRHCFFPSDAEAEAICDLAGRRQPKACNLFSSAFRFPLLSCDQCFLPLNGVRNTYTLIVYTRQRLLLASSDILSISILPLFPTPGNDIR
jgi:hypothetical protein